MLGGWTNVQYMYASLNHWGIFLRISEEWLHIATSLLLGIDWFRLTDPISVPFSLRETQYSVLSVLHWAERVVIFQCNQDSWHKLTGSTPFQDTKDFRCHRVAYFTSFYSLPPLSPEWPVTSRPQRPPRKAWKAQLERHNQHVEDPELKCPPSTPVVSGRSPCTSPWPLPIAWSGKSM